MTARFDVNTTWNKQLLFQRVDCVDIIASSGTGEAYIQAYEESGLNHWRGRAGERVYTIDFDMGQIVCISRIWLLMAPAGWSHEKPCKAWGLTHISTSSRLEDYVWQSSDDKENWIDIPGTSVNGFHGYKAVIDLDESPVSTRFFRLLITAWTGDPPTVHEVTFYEKADPPPLQVPPGKYVMIIRNEQSFLNYEKQDWQNAILGREGMQRCPGPLGLSRLIMPRLTMKSLRILKINLLPFF
ncbi:hypothetical protein JCM12294_24030 [Desulfocicer niacini]